MSRKVLVSAFVLLAVTSAAWAQTPKVEFTGIIGWTFADGVSGDPVKALNRRTYDRAGPKDSMNFGVSVGFFVTPSAEIGFLWLRQASEIEISGTRTDTLGDVNIRDSGSWLSCVGCGWPGRLPCARRRVAGARRAFGAQPSTEGNGPDRPPRTRGQDPQPQRERLRIVAFHIAASVRAPRRGHFPSPVLARLRGCSS